MGLKSKPWAVSLEKNTQCVRIICAAREVSLRSCIEGQILDLNVDIGNRVEQGQVLARIDNSINKKTVLAAKAELAALRLEVNSLQADLNEGLTQIKQAKITLQQVQKDLSRLNQLVKEGEVIKQSVEQAQNTADNTKKALDLAQ